MTKPSQRRARANARLRQVVGMLHRAVDDKHAEPLPPELAGRIACTEGCPESAAGCCSIMLTVERAEADYIVQRNPEAVAAAAPVLLEQARRIHETIGTAAIDGLFAFADGDTAREVAHERSVAAAYHDLRMPCAFLGPDFRCRIYRDRPLACRTHFVLSPPVHCTTYGSDPEHITLDRGTRLGAPEHMIRAAAHERGGEIAVGVFPQMMVAAMRWR